MTSASSLCAGKCVLKLKAPNSIPYKSFVEGQRASSHPHLSCCCVATSSVQGWLRNVGLSTCLWFFHTWDNRVRGAGEINMQTEMFQQSGAIPGHGKCPRLLWLLSQPTLKLTWDHPSTRASPRQRGVWSPCSWSHSRERSCFPLVWACKTPCRVFSSFTVKPLPKEWECSPLPEEEPPLASPHSCYSFQLACSTSHHTTVQCRTVCSGGIRHSWRNHAPFPHQKEGSCVTDDVRSCGSQSLSLWCLNHLLYGSTWHQPGPVAMPAVPSLGHLCLRCNIITELQSKWHNEPMVPCSDHLHIT